MLALFFTCHVISFTRNAVFTVGVHRKVYASASVVLLRLTRMSAARGRCHWRTHGRELCSGNNIIIIIITIIKLMFLVPDSTTRTPVTDMLYNTPTDELTNNSTTCYTTNSPPTDKNLPHPNILTCRDVGLWHCDEANFCPLMVNLLYKSCRIVVNLSVGGVVQHVRSRCPCIVEFDVYYVFASSVLISFSKVIKLCVPSVKPSNSWFITASKTAGSILSL